MAPTRKCSTCKVKKNPLEFYNCKTGKDGLAHNCKLCQKKSSKKYYNTPEGRKKHREQGKRYHNSLTEDQVRDKWLRTDYGITLQYYNTLLYEQKGVCAICSNHAKATKHKRANLRVDHCHTTGRIRGLLCHKCNVALGGLGDSIEGIEKALDYLKKAYS